MKRGELNRLREENRRLKRQLYFVLSFLEQRKRQINNLYVDISEMSKVLSILLNEEAKQ